MGGRRSRPIYDIVKSTKSSQEKIHGLSDSIEKEDIKGIVSTSGSLFSETIDFGKSFIHTQKLFESIKDKHKGIIKIPLKKLEIEVRREWAQYKKKNDIQINRAAEYNIIHAVSKVIKEEEKKWLPPL